MALESLAPSIHALERLAATESRGAESRRISPPAGLDAKLVEPMGEVPDAARVPLAELLPRYASDLKRPDAPPAESAATAEDSERALRLYARARIAWNDGKNADAITLLDEAEKADKGRAEIPLLRGDILAASGQRIGSLAAYKRVIDLGRLEPRACLLLGIAASEQGDHEQACRWLAGAIENQSAGGDPALPVIARAAIGSSLHALGRLVAGNEALESAARSALQFTSTTSYRADLQTLARRRSDLARDAGDAWARLGDADRALDAYELAAQHPSFDPSAITERRVYVLTRSGRAAEAALILLDDVSNASLRVDDRQLALFRYLSQNTDREPLIARALSELPVAAAARAAALGLPAPKMTAAVESRLARAASAIDPGSATQLLAAHLARHPSDVECARAWVATIPDAQLAQTAVAFVGANPLASASVGTAIASSARWRMVMDALQGGSRAEPGAALLAGAMLLEQGAFARAAEAIRVLGSAPGEAPDSSKSPGPAAAMLAARSGDWDHAQALLGTVPDPTQRARVLLTLQRPAEAKLALESALSESATASDLRLGADIAIALRDAEAGAALLRRAIEADPFDESTYEQLSGLYRAGAPLANQDRLFEVYRDLRMAVPSSRLLRAMSAQDAAQRGQLALAEPEVVSLLELSPDDELASRLAVAVWQRRAGSDPTALARAESTLRSLRDAHPASATLAVALATIVSDAGRIGEAESILRDHSMAFPSPLIDGAFEAFLRDRADRGAEADAMAILRLDPRPRPIDATIELARARARADDLAGAAQALASDLPENATLSPGQGAMIQLILADVGPAAAAAPTPERADAVLRIIDVALARSVAVTPGVHELRMALLASKPDTGVDQLISACRDASDPSGPNATRSFKRVIAALAQSDRPAEALRVAIAGLEHASAPDDELVSVGVRLVVIAGDASDLARVLDRVTTLSTARAVLEPIHPDGPNALDARATLERAKSEIAFMIGNYFASSDDRRDRADDTYRLALRYDPTNAMAANNLGYTLLERGINPEEAEALLESAYLHAPDDANVADSIGWLRYQQGRLLDTVSSDGTIVEGAVSLLLKALTIDLDGGSPVSLDHYADALWASGEREEAVLRWEEAITELERETANLEAAGRSNPEHAPLLESLRAKIAAASEGREPAIAPMRWKPVTERTDPKAPSRDEGANPVGNASNLQPR